MIIQLICPTCKKRTEVIEDKPFLSNMRRKFKCGHSQFYEKIVKASEEDSLREKMEKFVSMEGDPLFKHQIDCTIFTLLTANGRTCIFDEVGVGKTIETILPIYLRKDKMLPAIILCKSVAKMNWLKHWLIWGREFGQVISTSTEKWHPQFTIHILSYEMLRRIIKNGTDNNHKVILDRAKTIVIDESHLIKNDVSKRTKVVKKLCEGKKFTFALSGTQVENQSGELFPVFNIIRPDKYHNRELFLRKYWDMYRDGFGWKIGRMHSPQKFKEDTENFVIRRTMDEVLPNMPEVRKNYQFVELGDKVKAIYDKEAQAFADFYLKGKGIGNAFEFMANVLAKLNILRQITGLAKVEAGENFVEEHIEGNDRKLVIFIHHHKVADLYEKKLEPIIKKAGLHDLILFRSKDANKAETILEKFRTDNKSRIMLASTQASGQSINMQFCSDCLLSERQWTPSKEEQAGIGRFRRPGQKNIINFNYLIAVGTVDEHLTRIIDRKMKHIEQVDEGYKGIAVEWKESSVIKELAELLANSGKNNWQLQ